MKNNKSTSEPGFEALGIFLIITIVLVISAYIGII